MIIGRNRKKEYREEGGAAMEKEWFEKLTDEQKAKLRGMEGDTEKLIAFCREEKLGLAR